MAVTREGSASITHPTYMAMKETWQVSRDLYEGTGGFLDPDRPYLVPHPREWLDHSTKDASGKSVPNPSPSQPSAKLLMRRRLARYENLAEAILSPIAGALFQTAPTRTFQHENLDIAAWWENVDGKGTSITQYMRETWLSSAVFGHSVIASEKASDEAPTAADQALPYLCRYTPLDVLDWLEDDDGRVIAVKLLTVAPRRNFNEYVDSEKRLRVYVITADEWRMYGANGELLKGAQGRGDHGYGVLPVEYVYAKRRLLTPHIGRSLIGDPFLHIDAYNLTSEVRELLRNQTFAILNVPIGKDGDVEAEKALMGSQTGTSNVLFSSQQAAYVSPEGTNVEAYHVHLDRLTRMIYRLASAPWEGDSKDAESADSRKIKRSEYDQILAGFAAELQGSEIRLLQLTYRALYGDRWQARWQADGPMVAYPTTFQPIDTDALIDHITSALGVDLGETATKELKKKVARLALPDASKELLTTVDGEIDAQKYVSEEEKRQQEIAQAAARFAA